MVEGREDFDYTRHAAFCAFGFAYLGGFQYWLYNVKFAQWCGPLTRAFGHRATAPIKTFIDQGIHHPLIYFPSFFTIKAAVSGQPLSSAADKYRTEIWDSLKALWMVWVPAQVRRRRASALLAASVAGGRWLAAGRRLRCTRGSCPAGRAAACRRLRCRACMARLATLPWAAARLGCPSWH